MLTPDTARDDAMDRRELIRAHFDAYRSLTWAKELEPKFRAEGTAGAELDSWRQSWNQFSEKRDWEWWLEKTAKLSNAELQKEIAECKNAINAIGLKRQEKTGQNGFQQILNGSRPAERQQDGQSQTRVRGRGI